MLQLVLELLQAVLGEDEKKPHTLVGVVLRIANLVRFDGSEIVLLRRRRGAHRWRHGQDERTQKEKPDLGFHGCFSGGGAGAGFSAGGAASCFSRGRRGKRLFSNSSSMPIKSWRTIWSGGLKPSGDTRIVSSSSRIPLRKCISNCR